MRGDGTLLLPFRLREGSGEGVAAAEGVGGVYFSPSPNPSRKRKGDLTLVALLCPGLPLSRENKGGASLPFLGLDRSTTSIDIKNGPVCRHTEPRVSAGGTSGVRARVARYRSGIQL